MGKFKIGDRVVGVGRQDGIEIDNLPGTVVAVQHNGYDVRFDRYDLVMHSCGGACEEGYGWCVTEEHLRHLRPSVAEDKA